VFQVIDTGSGAVDNLVEFKFASSVRGSLNVAGTVAPAEVRLLPFCDSAAETQAQSKHVEWPLQLRCQHTRLCTKSTPQPALFTTLQASVAGGPVTRVDVRFTAFRLQLGWLAFSLPLGWADPKVSVTAAHMTVSISKPPSMHKGRRECTLHCCDGSPSCG
jgi:hypothetical protein